MHFNKILGILCLAGLILVGAACGGNEEVQEDLDMGTEKIEFVPLDRSDLEEDKVVAVYDGGEVTGSEFANYLAFRGFLNPMLNINNKEEREILIKELIFEQIFKQQTEITEADREQAEDIWQNIIAVYDEDTRQEGYEQLGTSEEQIKEQLTISLAVDHSFQTYFRQQVSESEIEEFLRESRTVADVRHILIGSETRSDEEALEIANTLYQELQQGADFAELAKEHTDDPGSKETGGLYEGVPVSAWVPEFKQATLEQEIGEIGQPVKTQFGYHIIRVEERDVLEDGEDVSFEDAQEQLAFEKMYHYFNETLPGLIKEINI